MAVIVRNYGVNCQSRSRRTLRQFRAIDCNGGGYRTIVGPRSRVFTLDAFIINGIGKIRVDDSTWKIDGADCPSGTKVRVAGIENTVLKVEVAG